MSVGWIRTEDGALVNLDHVASILCRTCWADPGSAQGIIQPMVVARLAGDGRTEITLAKCDTKTDARTLRDYIAERLVLVRDLTSAPEIIVQRARAVLAELDVVFVAADLLLTLGGHEPIGWRIHHDLVD